MAIDLLVEWEPRIILSYMLSCVVDEGGIPGFMPKTVPGLSVGKNAALLVCRNIKLRRVAKKIIRKNGKIIEKTVVIKLGEDLLPSILVYKIPDEIYEIILEKGHRGFAEWKKVLAAIVDPKFIDILEEKTKEDPKLRAVFAEDDFPKMRIFSASVHTEKVPVETARKILEMIERPEITFYEVLQKLEKKQQEQVL